MVVHALDGREFYVSATDAAGTRRLNVVQLDDQLEIEHSNIDCSISRMLNPPLSKGVMLVHTVLIRFDRT